MNSSLTSWISETDHQELGLLLELSHWSKLVRESTTQLKTQLAHFSDPVEINALFSSLISW